MDITRKVHLMHILNIMSTYLFSFFNRNEKSISVLDELAYDFPKKDELVDKLEITANLILKMKLDNFWFKKANIFSLIIALSLADQQNINIKSLASKLNSFAFSPPEDYKLAATEAVNNRRERLLRHQHINDIIERSI